MWQTVRGILNAGGWLAVAFGMYCAYRALKALDQRITQLERKVENDRRRTASDSAELR